LRKSTARLRIIERGSSQEFARLELLGASVAAETIALLRRSLRSPPPGRGYGTDDAELMLAERIDGDRRVSLAGDKSYDLRTFVAPRVSSAGRANRTGIATVQSDVHYPASMRRRAANLGSSCVAPAENWAIGAADAWIICTIA
jgi:hypothetical protein